MIVKFFKNKGKGNPNASIDYLLGKNREREGAEILKGNPELSRELANSLTFKNKYTVGCLSFEENDISLKDKVEIMESFEKAIFAGLEKDQYNIAWIEHTDKNRLELNFFIPNVELATEKRLQPYYHKSDFKLVDSWMRLTNNKFKLSDPHDPKKRQINKIDLQQSTPHKVIKEQIGKLIFEGISIGTVSNRGDIIELLQQSNFEIKRTTEKSISIAHELLNKNIRLTGELYEDREFDSKYAEQFNREGASYQCEHRERIEKANSDFKQAYQRRKDFNARAYRKSEKKIIPTNVDRMDIRATKFNDNNITVNKYLSRETSKQSVSEIPKLSASNSQIRQEGIRDNQVLRKSGEISISNTSEKRRDIQDSRWLSGFADLQRIGNEYAKRIQQRVDTIITIFRDLYSRIRNSKQLTEQTSRRNAQSQRRINESKYIIESANQKIDQYKKLNTRDKKTDISISM